jgi:hypothetical protein
MVKKAVDRILMVLPELKCIPIKYSCSIGNPGYEYINRHIELPNRFIFTQDCYKYRYNEIMNRFGTCNDFLIVCQIILHEYGHSRQSLDLIRETLMLLKVLDFTYTAKIAFEQAGVSDYIKEYFELPAEKDADEFAYSVIEKHFDLFSKSPLFGTCIVIRR